MRAVKTNLFPIGIVRIEPQRTDHVRLANEEVLLVWQEKAAIMIERPSSFFIIRIPTIQKHVEVRVVPQFSAIDITHEFLNIKWRFVDQIGNQLFPIRLGIEPISDALDLGIIFLAEPADIN